MRHHTLAGCLLGLVACTGCAFDSYEHESSGYSSDSDYSGYAPTPEPPEACRPAYPEWARMKALHDDAEASVHELIKCGGLQTQISRTFLIVVVASNRDLFDEAAYADLVNFAAGYGVDLQVPLNQESGGRWTTPLNA